GAARREPAIAADFGGIVQAESGVGVLRRDVTVGARPRAEEHRLPPARGRGIETVGRRRGRRETQLVLLQRRQLGRHEVRVVVDRVARARIHERAMPVHLRDGDVRVPVGNPALAGVRLEVHAREAVRGWDKHWPVLVVVIPVRVVLAGTPRSEHGVRAGSSRLPCPAWSCDTSAAGSASTSTLSPTPSAVLGLMPWTTWCILSVSVQNASSPKVSNRKMCCPSNSVRSIAGFVGDSEQATSATSMVARSQRCLIRTSSRGGDLYNKRLVVKIGDAAKPATGCRVPGADQAGRRPFRSAGRNGPGWAMSARAWSTWPQVFHKSTPRTRPACR